LIENPDLSEDQIYVNYISSVYGEKAVPNLKPAFQNAFDIVTSSLYTLGLCMANHSSLSCDYPSIYNRYVSGRWMKDPVFWLGHNVNKEYHYYKDIVNHLAPKHLKEKNARLFEEDPFLLQTDWIQAAEMMNKSFLQDIITEKDYSVALSDTSLMQISKVKDLLRPGQYHELYQTFYRTKVKAKISRGACKAYFSYRIWAGFPEERNQVLLDIFWEGINEMVAMKEIIVNEFELSPRGQWTWERDIKTVNEYVRKMTIDGWEEYGDVVIQEITIK
jgi:hypothetical protein